MSNNYGPTLNVRKMFYLYKSNLLPRELFHIVLLFMINKKSDCYKSMKHANYIALFKELDNKARTEFQYQSKQFLYEISIHRRSRRSRQRDKRLRIMVHS